MIRQTSITAYQAHQPKIGPQEELVYSVITRYAPVSDLDISTTTMLPISSVTARRNSLVKKGMIIPCGIKKNRTGHTSTKWKPQNA